MKKNWKFVIKKDDEVIKGTLEDSHLSASLICKHFENQGFEVLSVSCLAIFPFMQFLNPERRRFSYV